MKLSQIGVAAAFILISSAAYVGLSANNSASAWKVGHGASAFCNDDAKISFNWSFQNKEPNQAKWDIDLTVTDSNTGKSEGPVTVKATKSTTGMIDTDLTMVDDGKVTFKMTWTDGRNGVDTRVASYDALECDQPDRTIEVCRNGKSVTIPVSEKTKLDVVGECPTPEEPEQPPVPENPETPTPEPKQVQICRNGVEMTVSEDEVKDGDLEGSCPQTLGTTTELPRTGATEFITVVLATGTLLSAAYGSKKGKQR